MKTKSTAPDSNVCGVPELLSSVPVSQIIYRNNPLKRRQIRALKGPIKWQMPDGTIFEDTERDFMRRGVYVPYLPLFTTPDL